MFKTLEICFLGRGQTVGEEAFLQGPRCGIPIYSRLAPHELGLEGGETRP